MFAAQSGRPGARTGSADGTTSHGVGSNLGRNQPVLICFRSNRFRLWINQRETTRLAALETLVEFGRMGGADSSGWACVEIHYESLCSTFTVNLFGRNIHVVEILVEKYMW